MRNILVTLSLMISLSVFAQKGYFNEEYTNVGSEYEEISVIPIQTDIQDIDSILSLNFSGKLVEFSFANNAKVVSILSHDDSMLKILNKIILKKYSKKEIKKFPSLTTIISEEELSVLNNAFKSKYIIIPVVFAISSNNMMTFGDSVFRVYDIKNDKFVAWYRGRLNVNVGGTDGEKMLSDTFIKMFKNFLIVNFS